MTECDHKWIHLETVKWTEDGGFNLHWIRIDRYYCTNCMELTDNKRDEYQRETPEWYRSGEPNQ